MKKLILISILTFLLLSLIGTVYIKGAGEDTTDQNIAAIFIYPETSEGNVGENFTIEVKVSNVADLYGYEFHLRWNSTLLDCVEVIEGPFLKSGDSTFFTYKINSTEGCMVVDCTLLGDIQGVSGNGTLTTIKFYIKTTGECLLDLYDTILLNSAEQTIEHSTTDGYFSALHVIHDVAIINLIASNSYVNVTVENQGTQTETFNVSVYYYLLISDPLIGIETVTLEPNTNLTLIFTWNPPATGRYKIVAEASVIAGETHTEDNISTIVIFVEKKSVCNAGSLEETRLSKFNVNIINSVSMLEF
ncbi:hypothetical protein J7K27_02140 [Candidatus Bathyarchaeota archaeon]|nr:hypothetical protein [Candidatus Bathyarchaeota archaeon]